MPSATDAPRYPIGAVSRLTGVPIDTLRAWERRHRAVEPRRDERGRLYTERDVRKLRLLRALVERGHAIGRLAALSPEELGALDAGPVPPPPLAEADLAPITAALRAFDGAAAERELRRLATLLPPRAFVRQVALPLMRRVGEEWSAGRLTVAQEHLASAALRSLLGSLLRVHAPEAARGALLLATPSGERHELGILGAAMIAAAYGLAPVYLGPDVPASDLCAAAARVRPRAVILGVLALAAPEEQAAALLAVARDLPRGTELWVGGPRRPELERAVADCGGTFLADFDALEARLRAIA